MYSMIRLEHLEPFTILVLDWHKLIHFWQRYMHEKRLHVLCFCSHWPVVIKMLH